jgi:hypothetical protein
MRTEGSGSGLDALVAQLRQRIVPSRCSCGFTVWSTRDVHAPDCELHLLSEAADLLSRLGLELEEKRDDMSICEFCDTEWPNGEARDTDPGQLVVCTKCWSQVVLGQRHAEAELARLEREQRALRALVTEWREMASGDRRCADELDAVLASRSPASTEDTK